MTCYFLRESLECWVGPSIAPFPYWTLSNGIRCALNKRFLFYANLLYHSNLKEWWKFFYKKFLQIQSINTKHIIFSTSTMSLSRYLSIYIRLGFIRTTIIHCTRFYEDFVLSKVPYFFSDGDILSYFVCIFHNNCNLLCEFQFKDFMICRFFMIYN